MGKYYIMNFMMKLKCWSLCSSLLRQLFSMLQILLFFFWNHFFTYKPKKYIQFFFTLWGPVHTYPDFFKSVTFSFWIIQIEFARSHASDGNRIHSRETRLTRCADILVYIDWTRFSSVIGFTRPHVIGFVADIFLSAPESGIKKYPDSLPNAGLPGCACTEAVSGKKKLRIYVWTGPK